MTTIQKFFLAILPKSWGESMKAESQSWQMRCEGCGNAKSVWDAGGIRWKAKSVGKKVKVFCRKCGSMQWVAVEKAPSS